MIDIKPEAFFALLSDQTRLRCLSLLYVKGELCVCELSYALEMLQPKISRHLSLLKNAELIVDRRAGTWIYYKLHPELPDWLNGVIKMTVKSCIDKKPYCADIKNIKSASNKMQNCYVKIP